MSHFTLYHFKNGTAVRPMPSAELADGPGWGAAIGFFDGVHRGHQYLLSQMQAEAARRGQRTMAITFEEHPRLALSPTRYWPELITTNEEKLHLLAATGIDACAMLRFDHAMSMLTSKEFMAEILHKELCVRTLVVGYDHHFGSDLSSGYANYVQHGKKLGMEVLRERPFETGDLRISSSAVRRFLAGGNVEMARACLGRPYALSGTVAEGRRVGHEIGFPTANLHPNTPEKIVPGRGVYAVQAEVDGFTYGAMLNIGWRPTLKNGDDQTIEAHLFDYPDRESLYGHRLTLRFIRRVRDEQRFPSVEALRAQLEVDALHVQKMLCE